MTCHAKRSRGLGVPALKSRRRAIRYSRLVSACGRGAPVASVGRLLAARARMAAPAPGCRCCPLRERYSTDKSCTPSESLSRTVYETSINRAGISSVNRGIVVNGKNRSESVARCASNLMSLAFT